MTSDTNTDPVVEAMAAIEQLCASLGAAPIVSIGTATPSTIGQRNITPKNEAKQDTEPRFRVAPDQTLAEHLAAVLMLLGLACRVSPGTPKWRRSLSRAISQL